MEKIVVGFSGGVDSTLSLILLKERGYLPVAVSLKVPTWKKHINSFKKEKEICKKLGIEHIILDSEKTFEKKILSYFRQSLKKNTTPNPCVVCNRDFKIKLLFDYAKKHKIKYVATGHYAKIKNKHLYRPKDLTKDQTYGLCFLKKEWLKHLVFPLQDLTKKEVYDLIKKHSLNFSKIKQSQDFCYLKDSSMQEYLEKEFKTKPGEIVTLDGKVLGTHKGLWHYTIGQRKGLGKAGTKYYACGFDVKKNQLIVTQNLEKKTKEIFLEKVNLLDHLPKKINVKIRYSFLEVPAKIELLPNNKAKVFFEKPQAIVTPGQFCVFYFKDKCYGGGVIL